MLNLDQAALPIAEQAEIHHQWSTYNEVQEQIRLRNFEDLPMPPYRCPGYLMAEDLTAHDSQTLTRLYTQYKAWRDFTAEQLMQVKKLRLETENELRDIVVQTKKLMRKEALDRREKKPSEDSMQEEAEGSPRYRELKKKQQQCQELELDYDTRLDRFSSSMSLISRQITLRGQDIEQGIRGGNIGHGTPATRAW